MYSHERKRLFVLAACLFLLCLVFGACDKPVEEKTATGGDCFIVKYLDMGDGDATIIRFPDGTLTLIDCGEKNAAHFLKIKTAVKDLGADKIDNLIITHLHSTAAGNAADIIAEFGANKVYTPFVAEGRHNALYGEIKAAANKDTELTVSSRGQVIGEGDCFMAFLSPSPYGENDSPYNEFNLEYYPSDKITDDCSAAVFVFYKSTTFLFTGDATSDIEENIVNDYSSKYFDVLFGDAKIDLREIDFFKVPRRGGTGACSGDFLDLIKPRYAVISVSGMNNAGCPSSAVLQRITASGEVEILRTDTCGDITVTVDKTGAKNVQTQIF